MTINEHRKDIREMVVTVLGVATLLFLASFLGDLRTNNWKAEWPSGATLLDHAPMACAIIWALSWSLGLMASLHGMLHRACPPGIPNWSESWKFPQTKVAVIGGLIGLFAFAGLLFSYQR